MLDKMVAQDRAEKPLPPHPGLEELLNDSRKPVPPAAPRFDMQRLQSLFDMRFKRLDYEGFGTITKLDLGMALSADGYDAEDRKMIRYLYNNFDSISGLGVQMGVEQPEQRRQAVRGLGWTPGNVVDTIDRADIEALRRASEADRNQFGFAWKYENQGFLHNSLFAPPVAGLGATTLLGGSWRAGLGIGLAVSLVGEAALFGKYCLFDKPKLDTAITNLNK